MRVNDVANSMKKKTHDLIMIKIFSCFIYDTEVQNKVKFTDKIYGTLKQNLILYQQEPSPILYNYIDNDEVILEQALVEMKEEVYPHFHTKTILTFDAIASDELFVIYHAYKDFTYQELLSFIHCQIQENVDNMNVFIKKMKQAIHTEIQDRDLKFIPLSKDKDIIIDAHVSNSFFIQLYQDIKTTLKYLPKDYAKQEIFLKMRNISLMMMIENDINKGDKNVSTSNR